MSVTHTCADNRRPRVQLMCLDPIVWEETEEKTIALTFKKVKLCERVAKDVGDCFLSTGDMMNYHSNNQTSIKIANRWMPYCELVTFIGDLEL